MNTYITNQAPEVEVDEGEKEKIGFFSLLNFSHSQTLEAPVWSSDDSIHMLLVVCSRGIKN